MPAISNSGGVPTELLPLSFVLIVSMIKDILEDVQRHKSDNLENNKAVLIGNVETNVFEKTYWKKVRVGRIVKVLENE